jgi:hypothetical protein
VYLVGMFIYC